MSGRVVLLRVEKSERILGVVVERSEGSDVENFGNTYMTSLDLVEKDCGV